MGRESRRQAVRKNQTVKSVSRWQQVRQLMLRTSVIAGFVICVGASAYGAKHVYSLPIEQLVITGATENVPADLIKTLVAPTLAGGFFAADLDAIRADLERIPWVYRAAVRRQWPDTVVVTVEEQRPIARWGNQGFLNHEGVFFVGEQSTLFELLPQLWGPDSSAPHMMRHYQQVESLLQDTDLQVVSLEQDEIGQVNLTLDNGIGIALGTEHFLQRMQRFIVLWERHLDGQHVARIDMRYSHGAAVTFRHQSQLALTAVNELSGEEVR